MVWRHEAKANPCKEFQLGAEEGAQPCQGTRCRNCDWPDCAWSHDAAIADRFIEQITQVSCGKSIARPSCIGA
eukprot:11893936-Karenia_brevis.AAC.1